MAEKYVKEKDKTPEEQPSEVEIGNLTQKEFCAMTVKIIQDLRKKKWRHRLRRQMFKKKIQKI